MIRRSLFLSLLVLLCSSAISRADDPPQRRALLVGVTAYPNVGKEFQLQGGTNDVAVMARVLMDKFGFRPEEITSLTEFHGRNDDSRLPTRKNIEAAFSKLAAGIRRGDQVVVFLTGHGTELPTRDGPRGYFLPRDVAPWKGEAETGSVPNAIAGTEIGTWLRPIAEKQANLWVIVDACFSGRMVRGGAGTVRQLPTDPEMKGGLRVPRAAIREEAKRGKATAMPPIPLPDYDGVACLYACSPDELTVEERTVTDDPKSPVLGLLTRALGDVLLNLSSDITYRELHGRVRKFYAATGRSSSPNPLIEGAAINRVVLQSKILQRKSFVVGESEDGSLTVSAGFLHGLTNDSIMSVYPPPGQGDNLRGYVKITRVFPTSSQCVPHAMEKGIAAKKGMLINGRAEVHLIEYGANLLPVAIDPIDFSGREVPADVITPLRKMLQEMSGLKSARFRLTDSLVEARVHLRIKDAEVCFVPSLLQVASPDVTGRVIATHKIDENLCKWLQDKIDQVARAHSLLHLYSDASRDPSVKINTNLLQLDSATSKTGKPIDGPVKRVHKGDLVAYEIKNQGNAPVDVTILYLNANYEIDALFPSKNESNRIPPGKTLLSPVVRVNDKTRGMEYAIIIAVENRAKEQIELTALAPSRRTVAASVKQLESPLGRLLDQSLVGGERKRSASGSLIQSYSVDILSIEVIP